MRRPLCAGSGGAALVLLTLVAAGVDAGGPARHAGTLHSLSPAQGVLVIEERGEHGRTELVEIQIRRAKVVRIWRDPTRPWEWRERPTLLHRWAAGTFIVVIGQADNAGVVDAERVEIPAIERD
jgi:hypothetical protein